MVTNLLRIQVGVLCIRKMETWLTFFQKRYLALCLTSFISVLRLVVTALLLSLAQSQELSEIPKDLKFTCEGKTYGYYADISTNW